MENEFTFGILISTDLNLQNKNKNKKIEKALDFFRIKMSNFQFYAHVTVDTSLQDSVD